MTVWVLQDQLSDTINMLLDRHPMGLRVLLGEAEPPESEEIHLMYAAGRSGGELGIRLENGEKITRAEQVVMDAERFEDIIEKAGGWEHIAVTTREWAECWRSAWDIVVDHVRWVGGEFSRIDASQLDRIARKYSIHKDTVWRRRREFPKLLADAILRNPKVKAPKIKMENETKNSPSLSKR